MSRLCGSFLVRCWQMGRDQRRFEVEHIQSGERVVVGSLAALCDWVATHAEAVPDSLPAGLPSPAETIGEGWWRTTTDPPG